MYTCRHGRRRLADDGPCEVNEKGTSDKNDGNEVLEKGSSPPLDLDPNEVTVANEETLPYAEEVWQEFGARPTVCDTDTIE